MPRQTHGNTRLEIGWTIAPAVVLAVVMVPTVSLIWELARPPAADALNITVEGYQWWWGFSYTDDDMVTDWDRPITIADTMVVPTGREVYLSLESVGGGAQDANGDPDFQVIHSFWVPELFGKQDVMPSQTNHILFSVDEPGTYEGQCAEFCGLQHALMKLEVVALAPDDWDAWVENQQTLRAEPDRPAGEAGRGAVPQPALRRAWRVHRVPRASGDAGGGGGAQPHALRRPDAHMLRRLQLGRPTTARRSPRGCENPGAREARCEDARLQPVTRRDRCPRRLPVHPDVMEAITPRWRA